MDVISQSLTTKLEGEYRQSQLYYHIILYARYYSNKSL